MGELTPDAAALIRAGRAAFRPDASDRERVLHSLAGALGDGALLDTPHATPAGPAAARFSWGWGKIFLGAGSMLAVGAGVMVAAHLWNRAPAPVAAAPTPSAAVVAPPPAVVSPVETEGSQAEARDDHPSSVPRSRARSTPATSRADSLKEEVRLLSRAEEQLNGGAGGDALETLSEHERRFPKGALAEQRMAARVEALCALGRFGEARADMTKLGRAYPRSPHLDGVRRFCGSDLGGAP